MDLASKELLQKGVAEFRAGKHENAIEFFSLAIENGGSCQVIYESRSAAYEKIGKHGEALRDAKRVIELAPSSPQGYLRSARLFLSISRPLSARKMLDMAASRIPTNDTKRRQKLEQLSKETEDSTTAHQLLQRQKMCHVSKLPYEILSEIMLICVQHGEMKATRMSAVCSQWRSVALATPDLWRTVRLGQKHPDRLLGLYTIRSGSTPDRRAVINLQLLSYPRHTFEQLIGDWASSDRFKYDTTCTPDLRVVQVPWSAFNNVLKSHQVLHSLRSLSLSLSSAHESRFPPSEVATLDHHTPFQNLHYLDLDGPVNLDPQTCPLRSLRRLRLTQLIQNTMTADGYLDEFLRQNSELRVLELGMACVPRVSDANCVLEYLDRLCLDGPGLWRHIMERLVTPKLSAIELSRSSNDVCGLLLYRWNQSGFPPLVSVHLDKCGIGYDGGSLIALLRSLPTLERLEVTHCGDNIDRAIIPLSVSPTIICPRLQHVNLSSCPKIRGVTIRDLIRSRMPQMSLSDAAALPGGDVYSTVSALTTAEPLVHVLPIQTLFLDNCPNIPSDLLPWLRRNVPRFSCIYETKAQAKERRPKQ